VRRWLFALLAATGCSSLIGVSGDVNEIRSDILPDAQGFEAGADAPDEPDAADEE